MARGQSPDLVGRVCRLPGCDIFFTPCQPHQRYYSPAHRYDASRLRRAIPIALEYFAEVLAKLDEDEPAVSP